MSTSVDFEHRSKKNGRNDADNLARGVNGSASATFWKVRKNKRILNVDL